MSTRVERFARMDELMGDVRLGTDRIVRRTPLPRAGLSGATLERLEIERDNAEPTSLMLKTVNLGSNWTAYRTGDRVGREGALLGEEALSGVWQVYDCPYLAYAVEEGSVGLLMVDLQDHILPAAQRLTEAEEDLFLRALAGLHARFWSAPGLRAPWLAGPEDRFSILSPLAPAQEQQRGPLSPLFTAVERGWALVAEHLSAPARAVLFRSPAEHAGRFAHLPQTLLHGDAKIANCAWLSEGRLAAFDWAGVGHGPCGMDLGYFLAVDAQRLARPGDRALQRYRTYLAEARGTDLLAGEWQETVDVAVLTGAATLLWSKALAVQRGDAGAEHEWRWWEDRLARVVL